MSDRYVYGKEDVKEKLLEIKTIFEKNPTATIVVSDFVKAAYRGLAEGVEEDSYLGYLIYSFSDKEICATMTVDVHGQDTFFIKDFSFKDKNSKLEISDVKYSWKWMCYIWFLITKRTEEIRFLFLLTHAQGLLYNPK